MRPSPRSAAIQTIFGAALRRTHPHSLLQMLLGIERELDHTLQQLVR